MTFVGLVKDQHAKIQRMVLSVAHLVGTALQTSFVSARLRVWVWRVEGRVASLIKGGKGAVRTIDPIQEVVQEPLICIVGLVDIIVGLEQDRILGVDDRITDLEVEVGLWACTLHWIGGSGTINPVQGRVSALRDPRENGVEK